MTNAGQRAATARGAMLADPKMLGNSLAREGEAIFDPQFWAARGDASPTPGGRGAAWFVRGAEQDWVLRHARRGGLLAPLTGDCYLWMGEERVRTFAEWRLLHILAGCGLPVPKPVAARYRRSGLFYRCDLITERIRNVRPLSSILSVETLPSELWSEVGRVIARLHRAGVDHADLNAHNVLCADDAARVKDPARAGGAAQPGSVSIIDFDRGCLRGPGSWQRGNLARLRRSLEKISKDIPSGRFSAREWSWVEAGYESARHGSLDPESAD
jgi:3-deoxy-D-manno-octulosonic acid kinase